MGFLPTRPPSGDPRLSASGRGGEAVVLARALALSRVAYSAMREGLLAAQAYLHVETCDGALRLEDADAVLAFLYTHNPALIRGAWLVTDDKAAGHADPVEALEAAVRPPLMKRLGSEFIQSHWIRFLEEVADSHRNAVLTQAAAQGMALALRTGWNGYDNLVSALEAWAKGTLDDPQSDGPDHDVDSLLLQLGSFSGHQTHPCFKTRLRVRPDGARTSFSPQDLVSCGPEWAPDVALPVLAIRRSRLTVIQSREIAQPFETSFEAAFPEIWVQWEEALTRCGLDREDYLPMPVHPLQLGEVARRFSQAIRASDIVILPGVQIIQRPTLSVRTLTPVARPSEPQIKTAMTVQMTSVVRTLAPARVHNAPVLTDILMEILERDPDLSRTLRVSPEPVGVFWGTDPNEESTDYRDGAHLAAVFKANPVQLVAAEERRVPLNTLLSPSPLSQDRVIVDLLHHHGLVSREAVSEHFSSYVRMVTDTDIGMLARYGISLESHQQNIDVVFDGVGRPVAMVYRDINGGIEIFEPLLNAHMPGFAGRFHPVRRGLFHRLDVPLSQTRHTTLMSNLLPMAHVLSHRFGVPLDDLRAEITAGVAAALRDARAFLEHRLPSSSQGFVQATLAGLERGLLQEDLATKALLTMRATQSQAMIFLPVPNPLGRA